MAKIAVVMVDGVADWEIGPVLPAARDWFGDEVVVSSIDGRAVTSIGGLHIVPASALPDLAPLEADLWLLPGSERWQDGEVPGLSHRLRQRQAAGRDIAAICSATLALAHAGLLQSRPHTSNSLAFLRHHVAGYAGAESYREDRVVDDAGLITASGTSPVHFALACLGRLHPERVDDLAQARAMFSGEFA